MAIATFVKTEVVDTTNQQKSQAIVDVDGQEVIVEFWYNLIDVMGKDEVKTFLCAEALSRTGNLQDAHDLLVKDASGEVVENPKGNPRFTDTRNWQKSWLYANPIIVTPSEPEVDPLL
jgi:hypothetical protein